MSETKTAPVRLQRANFVVRDIDEALKFYRDVLKFDIAYIQDSEPTSYSYPVFEIPREAKLRFAVLSTEEQPRVMALTEVSGVEVADNVMPRRSAIVLDIDDIDFVLDGARKLGLLVHEEEELITPDGRKGREIGIVDTDGNLVVIYKILGRVD